MAEQPILKADEHQRALVREEFARAQIGKWIDEERERRDGNKYWKMLNAPFFIWLMSSVVLAGFFTFAERMSDKIETKRLTAAYVSRLQTEVEYRFEPTVIIASAHKEKGDEIIFVDFGTLATLCLPATYATFSAPEANPAKENKSGLTEAQMHMLEARHIYPEFVQRSITSLLVELSENTTDPTKLTKIENAIEAVGKVRKLVIENQINGEAIGLSSDVVLKPFQELTFEL